MKKTTNKPQTVLVILIAVVTALAAVAAADPLPPGWFKAGNDPAGYEVGTATGGGVDGGNAACIEGVSPQPGKFGTVMQTFDATDYRGKRMRLTASVKAEDVAGSAGMWMRVDGPEGMLRFDNTNDRRLKGTTGWQRQVIVLDVPAGAATVNFGLILAGAGKACMDELTFEEVDASVPVTSSVGEVVRKPRNLDFD